MKYASVLLIGMALLSGCGMATPVGNSSAETLVSAEWWKKPGKVTISAEVTYWLDTRDDPYARLGVTATPQHGKTAYDWSLLTTLAGKMLPGEFQSMRTVLLGEDGVLYIATKKDKTKPPFFYGSEFYRIGTFGRPASFARGTPLTLHLDPGVSLERAQKGSHRPHVVLRLSHLPSVIAKKPPLVKAVTDR